MTPLASRLVRDLIQPPHKWKTQLGDGFDNDDKPTQAAVVTIGKVISDGLLTATLYECSAIASAAYNVVIEIGQELDRNKIVDHPTVVGFQLHNERTWIECKNQEGGREGYLVLGPKDFYGKALTTATKANSLVQGYAIHCALDPSTGECGLMGVLCLSNTPVTIEAHSNWLMLPISESKQQELESTNNQQLVQQLLSNALCVYPLLYMVHHSHSRSQQQAPHKGLAREINHSLGKPGLYKLQPWHEVKLYVDTGPTNNPPPPEPKPLTAIADAATELHYTRKEGTALHQCRPHTRTLKSGKQIPVKGHPRGDAKYGIAQSYYKVMPERPSV